MSLLTSLQHARSQLLLVLALANGRRISRNCAALSTIMEGREVIDQLRTAKARTPPTLCPVAA